MRGFIIRRRIRGGCGRGCGCDRDCGHDYVHDYADVHACDHAHAHVSIFSVRLLPSVAHSFVSLVEPFVVPTT